MPHIAEINRAYPGCILFLLDQSGSMNEVLSLPGEPPVTKAQGVADAINRLISELSIQSTKGSSVYDHFHLGVITYGGEQAGHPAGFQGLRALSEVANSPLRVDSRTQEALDGAGGIIRKEVVFPIWFEPRAQGGTPMCDALRQARTVLDAWCASHPESFPPIVINITDGEATDGDPLQPLLDLQACSTQDGPVLTFNAFMANGQSRATAYPVSSDHMPPGPLRSLVDGSSVLPEAMRRRAASQHEMRIQEGARGVVIQASLIDVIRLLDIGTRPQVA